MNNRQSQISNLKSLSWPDRPSRLRHPTLTLERQWLSDCGRFRVRRFVNGSGRFIAERFNEETQRWDLVGDFPNLLRAKRACQLSVESK